MAPNQFGKGKVNRASRYAKPTSTDRDTNINESALSADATVLGGKFDDTAMKDKLDSMMGFSRFESGPKKVGWLINMHTTLVKSDDSKGGQAAIDYYFLDEEGGSFKTTLKFDPYFLISCKEGFEADIEEYLRKKLEGIVKKLTHLDKEDLSLPNHLLGHRKKLIRLEFHNVTDLLSARKIVMPIVEENKNKIETEESYAELSLATSLDGLDQTASKTRGPENYITEIHEYDVPYHARVSIDKDVRVGKWYTIEAQHGDIIITEMPDRVSRPDPVVMAYDIETTKSPLKFPDSSVDKIMMISYMIDGQGFLITNREIVSQDIEDFEYTPKPEFPGVFTIFNEENEKGVLGRFFEHIREEKPTVIATFNGDFFDWPFVDARAKFHGLDLYQEIGFAKDSEDEYKSGHCAHMDCFRWVKRDSYLPQGSQGLKAVTTAKLGYNPLEIDPELMTPYAVEKPQVMAEYSVSDAVATYYLYMKYVHPFIFSLCNILPLNPDEVLRKGTGTLCEMLLTVQAYKSNILLPNKHKEPIERFYNGRLLESETYVGGHVESLEAGVFRSDIPASFNVDTTAIDELLEQLDRALKFSIQVEGKKNLEDIENYDEVKDQITAALVNLKENPKRDEKPSIYHVDVASMYPNIMTTNRLQPDSMITEEDCAACDFNRPGKTCDRRMPWSWRGEFFPPKKEEYLMVRESLAKETFPPKKFSNVPRTFDELPVAEQATHIKKRLTEYSRKVYNKIKQTETVEREAIICQRENPFYVNTVRSFRDRRYEYKGLQKVWKKKVDEIPSSDAAAKEEAKKMVVLYDSLQLAHKVILNSFYGYVMRKGSRWYSMEMAGVTCLTGATIIQLARGLVERLGRPLELDTDGIWCILPGSFPEDFCFKLKDGKKLPVSYPCVMLNHLVHEKFTNHQYQTLVDEKKLKYETHSDNSIFFEVDGPYKAMILPTSKEEDKGLKKRYAVFNDDGSLAELKGFEIKRRGELRLIKAFQSQVFQMFLEGTTLDECYKAVASVATSWLNILTTHGATLEDNDLIDLISENRSMSKTLDEYGGQKSTSICTARRLAEFLGSQMVKDKGLACKYIISKKPLGAPVTERAVPVEIFSADMDVKSHYLKKWLKDPSITDFDPRAIIDWEYYIERLGSTVQKIITIPAAYQGLDNPVPQLPHPDWLMKRISALKDKKKQQRIGSYFLKSEEPNARYSNRLNDDKENHNIEIIDEDMPDIEDIADKGAKAKKAAAKVSKRKVQSTNNKKLEEPIVSVPSNIPDPNEDYSAWLSYQKQKWKAQKQARERRQHLFGESDYAKNNTGLSGMFRNQAEKAYSNSWSVLQYSSTDIPGQVRAFVYINNKIQVVRINIPRRIFVNFKTDKLPPGSISNCTVTKVNNSLPNGHSSVHLFKLEMPEETYQEEMAKANSILKHHTVEGIYESHIDFEKRVLLEVGTQCSLDDSKPGILGMGLEKGFDMDWLIPREPQGYSKRNYLADANFDHIHIHHISSKDMQVISVIPVWADTASVFVLRPSSQAQQFPNMKRMYMDALREKKESLTENFFHYQESLEFDVQYFDNLRTLYRKLGGHLSKLHGEKNTRALVALQSAYPERLKKLVRSLNDFPIMEIKSQGNVSMTLNWQRDCAKKVIKGYIGLERWISHLVNLANYSNIPLGNLQSDDTSYLIDILYARKLQESNIVLWWSPSPMPDNGGSEKDSVLPSMDPLELPTVNNPGMYNKVCVELEIRNLSVNTILTASIINEAEGTDMAGTAVEGENEISSFVENSFSSPALSVLSSMVKGWWNEAIEDNLNADMMVNSFLKWVASPSSYLYDRSLYYHVQNLSKKAFVQLVKEFRKLGTSLVYADQNRVLLSTSKKAVENTYAFANYLVKSIRSKSLFSFLDIDIKEYWDTLLWMDDVNYGGRGCQEIPEDQEELPLKTYMNWHMKKFLPPMLQTELEDWVVEFLQRIIESKEEKEGNGKFNASPRGTQIPSSAIQRVENKHSDKAGEEDYIGKGVLGNLERPLMKRIRFLLKRHNEGASNPVIMEEFTSPVVAGSVRPVGNVITQYINMLCAVYGLSEDLSLENQLLKRHLLEIIEVREFSPQAEFKNPSASLKLPQVICANCSFVRDFDFCRHDDLAHKETNGSSSYYVFVCENCGKDYKRVSLEERLVQEVQRMATLYQVQDLKCGKCRRTREFDLSEYCECSGSWVETIPRMELMRTIEVYKHVAKFYDFKLLQNLL